MQIATAESVLASLCSHQASRLLSAEACFFNLTAELINAKEIPRIPLAARSAAKVPFIAGASSTAISSPSTLLNSNLTALTLTAPKSGGRGLVKKTTYCNIVGGFMRKTSQSSESHLMIRVGLRCNRQSRCKSLVECELVAMLQRLEMT
jgi:hypothetical protein